MAASLLLAAVAWRANGGLFPRWGAAGHTLRVCADPDNLPFSNRAEGGFENRIAQLIAHDMDATVAYTWWPGQRSFLRSTLRARRCDVVMGTAAGAERVLTTDPYYCSSYVFVARPGSRHPIASFDDPALRPLRIGVPVIGQDYNSLPPNVALAHRGLVDHVVGFELFAGSDADTSPWYRLIDAVERGDVDVAIAWGPPAGYFGQRATPTLQVTPVVDSAQGDTPFAYAIAAAVRPGDTALRSMLNRALVHEHDAITGILRRYGVPLVHGTIPGAGEGKGGTQCG
jgi:quinoprotein dehydrogenase-associated probable ABC transporter substrate-binding protein